MNVIKTLSSLLSLVALLSVAPISVSQAQDAPAKPCDTKNHHAFDFWLGDWQVTANGKPAGTNNVVSLQAGCIVQENWVSAASPVTGTSYNFFNASTKKWQQLWIDNQGGNLQLSGERIGQQMILKSEELKNKEGKTFVHRITWTQNEDGTVRQYWEMLKEAGETSVLFDGLYKKKD